MDGTMQYEVGDKVRVLNGGWIGTITEVEPCKNNMPGVIYTIENETGCMLCDIEEIELHSPEPTEAQWSAYQHAYRWFNEHLFNNELEPCILTFSKKANSKGYFIREKWVNGTKHTHEIALNPDLLMERSDEETLSTLVHEQVHQWRWQQGPTRAGYHDKLWAEKMVKIGLQPDNGKGGITGTSVTHRIIPDGAFQRAFKKMPQEYLLPWKALKEGKKPKAPPKNKTKYTCPTCGTNVWGKPELAIRCDECNQMFVDSVK